MEAANSQFRFATFEVDVPTGELRKAGLRIRLQDQPFKVLVMLLERAGEVVSRDELKQRLWTDSEFGDFDQGINVAIKKIRTALGDESDNPRFIETLARRGYRFIAPVASTSAMPVPVREAQNPFSQVTTRRLPKWAYISAISVGLLLLAGFILLRRPHVYSLGLLSTPSSFRLAPLTGSLGYEADPQFSPDGKMIAYAWSPGDKDSPPNIYVKLLGAGNARALVSGDKDTLRALPAWSPDGRFIACVRAVRIPLPDFSKEKNSDKESIASKLVKDRDNRKPNAAIYLIPAVGGEEKKLFDIGFISDLKWSPDGKWFLIGTRENKNEPVALYRYSIDGSERKQLTFPPANFNGDTVPTFSPDGSLIAFSRNHSSGGSDIFVMPSNGGQPRQITFDAQHVHGITFTGDGKQLIFSSAREGGARRALWRVAVTGGRPMRLPFGTDNADMPAIDRDGDHLAYVQLNWSAKIWAYDIPANGEAPGEPKVLIGSRQLQVGPQYSPDGKRIAFASSRTGPWEIWISAADGSNPIQLTNFGDRQTGTPRWSYDGKYIVFDARPERRSDIYSIDSQGGTPRRLTSGPYDNVVPSFSRDGKWVYYSSNAGGNWDLWKVAMNGDSKPVQLTHNGGFSTFESTDSRTLYYTKWDKPGIYSMPAQGGPETLVTIDHLGGWGAWAVVEDGLYFLRPVQKPGDTKQLLPSLAFYSLSSKTTKDVRILNDTPNPGPSLAISPDRKTVLYTQPDQGGADIMIVDNFR